LKMGFDLTFNNVFAIELISPICFTWKQLI